VPKIAARLASGELEEALKKVPLEEQKKKWRDAATESWTKEELDDCRRKVAESIRRMETILEASPWLAGEEYSLADINSYSMVVAVPRIVPAAMNDDATPRSMDWLARMNARPAVKAALATSRTTEPPIVGEQ